MSIIFSVIIPLIGTSLGAFLVFFIKSSYSQKIDKILLGFSGGVMLSASFFSLIIPSIKLSQEQGKISWFPTVIGFLLGVLTLVFIDKLSEKIEKIGNDKTNVMLLAITIHNIPEGMAVGVGCASALNDNTTFGIMSALTLSLGIAIQNIPEGAIISAPLMTKGMSKKKAFFLGVLSGVVEPVFCVITMCFTIFISNLLPYFLSFASGAMFFCIVDELFPSSKDDSKCGLISATFGFALMMILDVALS